MKTYVIGAGGVGGYYFALMAHAGADITLVCRPAVSQIFRTKGLRLLDRETEYVIEHPRILDSIADISNPELILLAVKTYHLDEVAKQLAEVVSDKTIVLTLQNGIEADLQVRKYLDQCHISPGLTWVLSTMIQPGFVEQKAPRTFIRFGARGDAAGEQMARVDLFLKKSGVQAEISDNITRDLWGKLIWLANFAGMAGLRRKPIGLIVNNPDDFDLWVRALDETLAVARAVGVWVEANTRETIIGRLEAYKTTNTDFKPSLLKDLENGRATEIEALSGTLVRLGKMTGIETPIHESFYAAISGPS